MALARATMARRSHRELVWAASVGLVLADSSIVTLALPEIQRRFDTSVVGVSWVLTAFNLVLALAVLPAARLVAARGAGRARSVWSGGVIAFAAASLACALAGDIGVLIGARCAQALAGAALIAGAIELLARSRGSHPRGAAAWGAASLVGLAIGPAVGGLLTELISWQSIFAVQVPVALAVLAASRAPERGVERGRPGRLRPAPEIALALLSAGLTGALFLLVILLTEGWGRSALEAALVVSMIAVATVAARRLTRRLPDSTATMAAGALASAAGLAGLGLLPDAETVWTLAPQALIGVGIALALPGLTGRALAGADPAGRRAAGTIAARHLGIVAGLVALTPLFSAELPQQERAAELSGTALVLEAKLPPRTKVELATAITRELQRADGRLPDLAPAFASVDAPARLRPELARLQEQLAEEIDKAATNAFSTVFLIAAAIALAAVVPILLGARAGERPDEQARAAQHRAPRRVGPAVLAGTAAVGVGVVAAYLALGGSSYEPRAVADPCAARPVEQLRSQGDGILDRLALSALDGAACELRVTREELAMALVDERSRERFAAAHGIDEDEVDDAVRSGLRRAVDDAERAKLISSLQAGLLRSAVDAAPLPQLLDLLRTRAGGDVLDLLSSLIG